MREDCLKNCGDITNAANYILIWEDNGEQWQQTQWTDEGAHVEKK